MDRGRLRACAVRAGRGSGAKKAPDLSVTSSQLSGAPAPGQAFARPADRQERGQEEGQGVADRGRALQGRQAQQGRPRGCIAARSRRWPSARRRRRRSRLTVPAAVAAGRYRVIACADARAEGQGGQRDATTAAASALTVVAPAVRAAGRSRHRRGSPIVTPRPAAPRRRRRRADRRPPRRPRPPPPRRPRPRPPRRRPSPFPQPPLPPADDPQDVAPDPPATGATTVAEGTEFLYTGADPIQKEVDAGTIAPPSASPSCAATCSPDGADAGTTPTRCPARASRCSTTRSSATRRPATDGGFDLAVNGGEDLVLHVEQDGFMRVQRTEDGAVAGLRRRRGRRDDALRREVTADRARTRPACRSATSDEVSDDGDGDAQRDADVRAGHRRRRWSCPTAAIAAARRPRGARHRVHGRRRTATRRCRASCRPRAPTRTPSSSASTRPSRPAPPTSRSTSRSSPTSTTSSSSRPGTIVPAAYYDEEKAAWVPSENGARDRRRRRAGGDRHRRRRRSRDRRRARRRSASTTPSGRSSLEHVRRPALAVARRGQALHAVGLQLAVRLRGPDDCDAARRGAARRRRRARSARARARSSASSTRRSASSWPSPARRSRCTTTAAACRATSEAYSLDIPLTGGSIRRGPASASTCEVTVAGREFAVSLRAGRRTCRTRSRGTARTRTAGRSRARRPRPCGSATSTGPSTSSPRAFQASFAQFGGSPVTGDRTRRRSPSWQQWERPLGTLGAGSDALGGWTLDVHHSYDPQGRVLHRGDGTRVTAEAIRSEIDTVAGVDFDDFGRRHAGHEPRPRRACGHRRRPPTAASTSPTPTRNRVVQDHAGRRRRDRRRRRQPRRRRRRRRAGRPSARARGAERRRRGAGRHRCSSRTPATRASAGSTPTGRSTPSRAAATPDDARRRRPRHRGVAHGARAASRSPPTGRSTSPSPAATASAGSPPTAGSAPRPAAARPPTRLGDGGPAVAAALDRPVRRRGRPATGRCSSPTRCTTACARSRRTARSRRWPATAARASAATAARPRRRAIGQPHGPRRRRRTAPCTWPTALHHAIRRIARDGTISRYAGTGDERRREGDGGARCRPSSPSRRTSTWRRTARVLIADAGNGRVRRAAIALPGFSDAELLAARPTTASRSTCSTAPGRHLRDGRRPHRRAPLPLRLRRGGRLSTITDGDGNVTTIERDGAGKATAIVAPGGLRTALTIDADGYLGAVANPAERELALRACRADDAPAGLLKTLTDPLGEQARVHLRRPGPADRATATRPAREVTARAHRSCRTASGSPAPPTLGREHACYESVTLANGDTRTTTTEPSGARQ